MKYCRNTVVKIGKYNGNAGDIQGVDKHVGDGGETAEIWGNTGKIQEIERHNSK